MSQRPSGLKRQRLGGPADHFRRLLPVAVSKTSAIVEIIAEGHPTAVRADAAPASRFACVHSERRRRIRLQDPAASERIHAVAGPHGLGDDSAVVTGRDLAISRMKRQRRRWTDNEARRVCRVRPNRPAEAAFKPVGQQVACSIKLGTDIARRNVRQFASRFEIENSNPIGQADGRKASAGMDRGTVGVVGGFLIAGMNQVLVLQAARERPQADAIVGRADSSCGQPLPGTVKAQSRGRRQRVRGEQGLTGKHDQKNDMVGPAAGDEAIAGGVKKNVGAALVHGTLKGARRSQGRSRGVKGIFLDLATVSLRHQQGTTVRTPGAVPIAARPRRQG